MPRPRPLPARTQTVYHFDELSDRAKRVARDWYRDDPDLFSFSAEHVFEYADDAATMIGICLKQNPVRLMNGKTRNEPAISYSGFSSQGDGASFEGTYYFAPEGARKIAAEFPMGEGDGHATNNELNRIARTLHVIQANHGGTLSAAIGHQGRGVHSGCMDIVVEHDGDDPAAATADAVTQLLRDFADWIYACLEAEHEYATSDAAVDENILANEYEFDEDGHAA